MDTVAYPDMPISVLYECESDMWFITSSDKGIVQIKKEKALSFI